MTKHRLTVELFAAYEEFAANPEEVFTADQVLDFLAEQRSLDARTA